MVVLVLIFLMMAAAVTGESNVTVFNPIRINCGGARYTDPTTGIRWLADTYNLGNKERTLNQCNTNTTIITNLITVPPSSLRPIYCTNRFNRMLGSSPTPRDIEPYQYNIPVPAYVNNSVASYTGTVRLHFADLVRERVCVCVSVRTMDRPLAINHGGSIPYSLTYNHPPPPSSSWISSHPSNP
jgi:hypothetical protein